MKVRYAPAALEHLRVLFNYIALRNETAALAVFIAIHTMTNRLSSFPYLGHATVAKEVYEIVVPGLQYVIAYKINEKEIIILGIYHGKQSR